MHMSMYVSFVGVCIYIYIHLCVCVKLRTYIYICTYIMCVNLYNYEYYYVKKGGDSRLVGQCSKPFLFTLLVSYSYGSGYYLMI